MRTIKFRGKILGINGWVYGYFYHCVLPKGDAFMILTEDNVEIDRTIAPKHHLAFSLFQDMYLVEGETVGQFTGLFDKNGKEIYEGDIVEYYELCTYCINPDCEPHLIGYGDSLCKKTSEVEFTDGSFELNYCGLHKEDLDELKEREERDVYFETNGYEINDSIIGIKVIGNIHDNPQLINK